MWATNRSAIIDDCSVSGFWKTTPSPRLAVRRNWPMVNTGSRRFPQLHFIAGRTSKIWSGPLSAEWRGQFYSVRCYERRRDCYGRQFPWREEPRSPRSRPSEECRNCATVTYITLATCAVVVAPLDLRAKCRNLLTLDDYALSGRLSTHARAR